MQSSTVLIQGIHFPVYSVNTLVIGSGAAGLKAAISVHERGQNEVAIITERWGGGASNNSGSDKQTYYKLSLAGTLTDSPMEMAKDLFTGGLMHGDIALCEAQHSAQAFYELVQLGVPFPYDRYGAFPGYRTDHDYRGRATSAGPLTSRYMFEALARRAAERNIPVLDRHQVVALLAEQTDSSKRVIGAVALNLDDLTQANYGLVLFNAVNVVLATGGPGGMYEMSAYPPDQIGSIGLALRIGAIAQNLTESQFGLASIKHRWNVSGSYQQVIPRYVSTDSAGRDERDFLNAYFPDMPTMAGTIFRKGYQWPFDPRKISGFGSSLIDIAVYQETVLRGRRVYLDFTRNPRATASFAELDLAALPAEAREYLQKSNALRERPIERLAQMNPQAIDLYRTHDIDLNSEYLEIACCAQHNNGGLRANHWWESNIMHLFPVGEVNGTHGVYRPGGAALNAGQVGALRASMYIARNYSTAPPDVTAFSSRAESQVASLLEQIARWLSPGEHADPDRIRRFGKEIRQRMTRQAAQIRKPDEIKRSIVDAWRAAKEIAEAVQIDRREELPTAFRTLELAVTHAVYLEAIGAYIDRGGASRGSYLIVDPKGNQKCGRTGDIARFTVADMDAFVNRFVLEVWLDPQDRLHQQWVPVRPIPTPDLWFENVWKDYVEGKHFTQNGS